MADLSETTLYRPVGPKELALIPESGYREFLPRRAEQPIFYPVLNEEYAVRIARNWSANNAGNGYQGFVMRFRVNRAFLEGYEVHRVGSAVHREYWIPAEDLAAFNAQIVERIEVVRAFAGPAAGGVREMAVEEENSSR